MSRGCALPPGEEAPRLRVQVIGRGQEVLRLKKRLECAAGALGVHLAIEHLPDDVRAAELSSTLSYSRFSPQIPHFPRHCCPIRYA